MKLFKDSVDKKLAKILRNGGFALDAFECIKSGADLSKIDVNSQALFHGTPEPLISAAAFLRDLPVVFQLINHGADVNIKDNADITPLMYAVNPIGGDTDLDIVKLLVENGADVNASRVQPVTNVRESVIGLASYFADVDLVKYLIDNGAGKSIIKEDVEKYEARIKEMDCLSQPTKSYDEIKERYITVLDMMKEELVKNEKGKQTENAVEL